VDRSSIYYNQLLVELKGYFELQELAQWQIYFINLSTIFIKEKPLLFREDIIA
jgi:hypothetical protein